MEAAISQRIQASEHLLGTIDPARAATLLTVTTDVTLVIDRQGSIEDISLNTHDATLDGLRRWVGRQWAETVTVESRPKIVELLRDAAAGKAPRWRHLNHPMSGGADLPLLYAVIDTGAEGRLLALGRDMRPLALLQRRLVDAQQNLERDYVRLRQAETRYRMLFNIASEAVLVVDADTRTVLDANPAASEMLGEAPERIVGRAFPQGFDLGGTEAILGMLNTLRGAGRAREVSARLAHGEIEIVVAAALLKQDEQAQFVIRLRRTQDAQRQHAADGDERSRLVEILNRLPDGVVIADESGRIRSVNRAFLQLLQLDDEQQVVGAMLENWLGAPGVDCTVLLAHLREHGTVRLFKSTLRDQYGTRQRVEICAVQAPDAERRSYALSVRNIEQRLNADEEAPSVLPRSIDQLTELVGRVPLKDLVREAADVVERLCIEAALNLTGDNRASAAEILGLSRQSLYVKLRRHGLGDLPATDEEA